MKRLFPQVGARGSVKQKGIGLVSLRSNLVVEDLTNTKEIIPTRPLSVYDGPSVK